MPAEQIAHSVVAGILGPELLASLDGDRASALALFDRARALGDLLDRLRPLAALLDLSAPKTSRARKKWDIMTENLQTDVVTGAFSYSGAAIARELLAGGHQVRTLTGHPGRHRNRRTPAGLHRRWRPAAQPARRAHPLQHLLGTFSASGVTHDTAVTNSRILFEAAAHAGIQRIVHVSITHADPASPYPYFRGKAEVERHLKATAVSYAIVRPAILFGANGVLINNIAWLLRHLPVFAIGDRGSYRIRPVHVDDLARLCAELGARSDSTTLDAVGPQSLTFRGMVTAIRAATVSHAVIVPAPGWLIPPLSGALGAVLCDVLLTREEYQAMAAGLADSDAPSTGQISFTDWVAKHGDSLGRTYASELDRHYR